MNVGHLWSLTRNLNPPPLFFCKLIIINDLRQYSFAINVIHIGLIWTLTKRGKKRISHIQLKWRIRSIWACIIMGFFHTKFNSFFQLLVFLSIYFSSLSFCSRWFVLTFKKFTIMSAFTILNWNINSKSFSFP